MTEQEKLPRPPELDNGFLGWQQHWLAQPVPENLLHSRTQGGTELRYIAGHDAIAMANRIFGAANWSYSTQTVWRDGGVYHAIVTLQVHGSDGRLIERGDLGTADIQGYKPRQEPNINAIQMAAKGSVTDAVKRCLRTFGPLFGLDLYEDDAPAQTRAKPAKQQAGASAYDDDGELASAPSTKTCPGCGGTTTFRSGRNKAGKDYSGYFCDTKCGAAPQWIDTKGGQR